MKEIVVSGKRIKLELLTWGICFVVANFINLYAILSYQKTSFLELFTSLGYVLIVSLALYFVWSLLRIVFYGIKHCFSKKEKD